MLVDAFKALLVGLSHTRQELRPSPKSLLTYNVLSNISKHVSGRVVSHWIYDECQKKALEGVDRYVWLVKQLKPNTAEDTSISCQM
jgi:hypothetical protein